MDKYLTKDRVQALFNRFNTDDDDTISKTNFRDAFSKLGIDLTQEEIDAILAEHDLDGDSQITLKEFETMLRANL